MTTDISLDGAAVVPLDDTPLATGLDVVTGRRRLLAGLAGLVGTGAVQLAAAEEAQAAADPVLHLLRRATFGPTPGLVSAARKLGARGWLEAQLKPAKVPDAAMAKLLTRWPRLRYTPLQVANAPNNWEVMRDLVDATIARNVWSNRQLFETVVDFWNNHLHVTCPHSDVTEWRHTYDRDVIRKHAFGKFSDMLVASAKHPAMLRYLNNADSSKRSPNENYGREVLELHTVGINGGYTERDMWHSTLILTGLSIDWPSRSYRYRSDYHYVGRVQVMGFRHANGNANGEGVAVAYLRYLARHPKTAHRIARKLCVRFVGDNPPATLVSRLAKIYLANDTAIVPVLRALFTSPEFAKAPLTKVRTPYEDLVATVRILGLKPQTSGTDAVRALQWLTHNVGQPPMGWPLPNGYADVASGWASAAAVLGRWNVHLNLANNWWPKNLVRPAQSAYLPKTLPATYGALVDHLARRLLLPPLSAAQRTAACQFLEKKPTDPLRSTDPVLAWRFGYLMALLLDTPNFARR